MLRKAHEHDWRPGTQIEQRELLYTERFRVGFMSREYQAGTLVRVLEEDADTLIVHLANNATSVKRLSRDRLSPPTYLPPIGQAFWEANRARKRERIDTFLRHENNRFQDEH